MPETVMAARCDDWFSRYVERHITDAGRVAVRRHREAGDVCADRHRRVALRLVAARPPPRHRARRLHRLRGRRGSALHRPPTEPALPRRGQARARARASPGACGFRLEDAVVLHRQRQRPAAPRARRRARRGEPRPAPQAHRREARVADRAVVARFQGSGGWTSVRRASASTRSASLRCVSTSGPVLPAGRPVGLSDTGPRSLPSFMAAMSAMTPR